MSSTQQSKSNSKSGSSGSIYRSNTVDFTKFQFGDVETNAYGGKSLRVKYDGQSFMIQTPRMRLPYGLGKYEEKDKSGEVIKTKYSLDLSFAGYENDDQGQPKDPKVKEFFDFMNGMHKLLLKKAKTSAASWFEMNEDDVNDSVVKMLVRDVIRYAKDKTTKKPTTKYPPTFRAKVGFWEGSFTVKAYDGNNKDTKDETKNIEESLTPGTEAVAILRLNNVTLAGGKCGYNFSVSQIKYYRNGGIPSYAFIEDETDEKPLKSKAVDADRVDDDDEPQKPPVSTHVQDSDDEAPVKDELDDDEEEEEEKPPTPPPVKKTVAKKTTKKN